MPATKRAHKEDAPGRRATPGDTSADGERAPEGAVSSSGTSQGRVLSAKRDWATWSKPALPSKHGRLASAARAAIDEVLAVRSGERVVVIAEPTQELGPVGAALFDAATARGADALLLMQRPRREGEPMDRVTVKALEEDPDVFIALTSGPLGTDPERVHRPIHGQYGHYGHYLIGEGRSRGFWSPGITRKTFERMVPIDYPALRDQAAALKEFLSDVVEFHVRSTAGTLTAPVLGAKTSVDDGDLRAPGRGGNLPAGELLVPVATGGASGRVAVDATVGLPDGARVVGRPVLLELEEGVVTRASGGPEADAVQAAFADAGRRAERAVRAGMLTRDHAQVYAGNTRRLVELGVGLNPQARICGVPLIDEKAAGAVHLTFGAGAAGAMGAPEAPLSIDAILGRASMTAVLSDGAEVEFARAGRVVLDPRAARA